MLNTIPTQFLTNDWTDFLLDVSVASDELARIEQEEQQAQHELEQETKKWYQVAKKEV